MNKYQRLVIIVAAINVLVMLLFPPFNNQPLAKGMLPSFDGFYPIISQIGSKPIYRELLTLQLMFITINVLCAWLVLQSKTHHGETPDFAFTRGIAWFLAVNLLIIFAFPPFEPYQNLVRNSGSSFDSFYFVFGDRSRRPFFTPLLFLECMLVTVNALALLLLFNAVKRDDAARCKNKIMQLTEALPDATLLEIGAAIQHKLEEHQSHNNPSPSRPGRKTERRHHNDPRYHGPERRQSIRRGK